MKQLKLPEKQHEPLSAVLSGLHVRQSNELLRARAAAADEHAAADQCLRDKRQVSRSPSKVHA